MLYYGKFMPASLRTTAYIRAIQLKLKLHPVKSPCNRAAVAKDS